MADRRVQRTRATLQKALIDLIREHGYDAITIQDIADRANIGRTTFYLHFSSKDELFMSCHETIFHQHLGSRHRLSRAEMLSPDAPAGLIAAFRQLEDAQALVNPVFQGKDSLLMLRQIREKSAQDIEDSLQAAFPDAQTAIPLDMLAGYLAGARIALMQWWLEKRRPYPLETLVQTFHRLQRAAIRDAFGLTDDETQRAASDEQKAASNNSL